MTRLFAIELCCLGVGSEAAHIVVGGCSIIEPRDGTVELDAARVAAEQIG
jgi:hypothetical protein